MSEPKPEPELLYSGVVQNHAVSDPAWDASEILNIRVVRRGEEEALLIETQSDPVRAYIRLDKRQADCLYRCMRNAMARWDGREP